MDFFQLDVFARTAYQGNPLAVFPEASGLSAEQMQAIAREMNLSETTFVTRADGDEYDVRIFTPLAELPFAGHPTVGTGWLLLYLGVLDGDTITQHSPAGGTPLEVRGNELWFERPGTIAADEPDIAAIASALGLDEDDVGYDWDGTRLQPAAADAGVSQLMVPVRDAGALGRAAPPWDLPTDSYMGAYCFTRVDTGIRARGFFPGVGVPEDPATGSAAAGLGLFLGNRVGDVDTLVTQGVEMGRASYIGLEARNGTASIGGSSRLVLKGKLELLT